MAGGKFCPKCGFSNPPQRGACLMCYARLDQAGGGHQCPHCNAELPAGANFCASCGGAIAEGMIAIPAPLALATLLMEAGGGDVFGGAYHEPAVAEEGHFDDFAAVGDESAHELPPATAPELPSLEHFAPPVAAPAGSTGPAAVEEEEEEMFVPPPPGLITAEPAVPAAPVPPTAEDFAPPPPPPAAHEDFAPPPPPPEEEAFAPPPPPPDMMDLSEEPAAPAPAAPPAGESADFDFGDWALELPQEEEEEK